MAEVRSRLPNAGVSVFSSRGEEVFGAKPPAPPAGQVPAGVRAAIASGIPVVTGSAHSVPLMRGDRCSVCHAGGPVVGVLTVDAAPSSRPSGTSSGALADSVGDDLDALTEIIRDGYLRLMLAPQARFDEYFAELAAHVPGVRAAAYAWTRYSLRKARSASAGGFVRTATLRAEARCLGCHESAKEVDGATVVVAFDRRQGSQREMLPTVIKTVLEQVSNAGLGRLVIGFLDDVAHTGAVRALTLHDAEGRLFHDSFGHLTPPPEIDSVLRTGTTLAFTDARNSEIRFVDPFAMPRRGGPPRIRPMVRGAIEIRVNDREAHVELAGLQRASAVYGFSTIVLVSALLAIGLYYTVIRPVQAIGTVADLVGAGRLDATVHLNTADEVGRLGRRVNEMVTGLRQKVELSKFVSRETLHEVEANAGAIARGGERRRVAILFSDIRGFTPFAESASGKCVVASHRGTCRSARRRSCDMAAT